MLFGLMKHPRHTSPLDTSHLARYGSGMETNTEAPDPES